MNLFKRNTPLLEQATNEIERQRVKIQNLNEELTIKNQSFEFIKTYFKEVWNRDTPFLDKINTETIILTYYSFDELHKLVGSKLFEDNDRETLEIAFNDYYNFILELSIGRFLLLIADLKSYRQGSSENENKYPDEYFQWRLDFLTQK